MIGRCRADATPSRTAWTERFLLTAITAEPVTIAAADAAGVDRIGLDIERLGKTARQGRHAGARISAHELEELALVAAHVRRAEVFVRVNPLHAGTGAEVERALELGARVVMLPQFRTAGEAGRFVELVGGRAEPVLLVETAEAARRVREIVAVEGVREIMVGLNDLHWDLGLRNPFSVVVSDLIASVSAAAREAEVRFGFGGLGRVDDGSLPVAPEMIYSQYSRLRGTTAWLSRSFFRGIGPGEIGPAVAALRRRMAYWEGRPEEELELRRAELARHLALMGA